MIRLLPTGTLPVGGGLAVLGMAAYLHLAAAGHHLDADGYSSLAALWAIIFTVSLGLFMPIEQEMSRYIANGHERGLPVGRILAYAGAVAVVLLALLTTLTLALARPLAGWIFGGDTGLSWALAAALTGLAAAHTSRGLLAGLGLFRRYGTQLGIDGGLRIALVSALAAADITTPLGYGLVLALAPLTAAVLTTAPALRAATASGPRPRSVAAAPIAPPPTATTSWGSDPEPMSGPGRPGARIGWHGLLIGLGLLTASSLLAQIVVNVGVINARLLAPAETSVAGALLSALVLVRIPLFAYASLQTPLLPGLSVAVAAGDRARFRALLHRALMVVSLLGITGGIPVVLLGPWLVRILFNTPAVLSRTDFGWLAAGTLAYLWALVYGHGLLASARHGGLAAAWAAGVAVLTAITLSPLPITTRVEIGYVAGALVAAAGMALLLRRPPPVSGPVGVTGSATASVAGRR